MELNLHPTPRPQAVVLEQMRAVALKLRREALVLGVIIAVMSGVILVSAATGDAASWFDSDEWAPVAMIIFALPFALWRGESPFRHGFLWTLPVERRTLLASRVFAGWVWMIATVVVFFVWQVALAALLRVAEPQTLALAVFPGSTASYLFGSALVIGLRHPLRWLFGAAGFGYLLGFAGRLYDDVGPLTYLSSTSYFSVLTSTLLWAAAGLVAACLAIWRHREQRRN